MGAGRSCSNHARRVVVLARNVSSLVVQPVLRSEAWRIEVEDRLSRLAPKALALVTTPIQPEDLIASLVKIQSTGGNRRTSKFLKFLNKYTVPFRELQRAFDVMVQPSGVIGCSIWGAMRLVLSAIENNGQALGTIADEMTKFALALPRLTEYKSIFSSSLLLQRSLARVYIIYLDFCIMTANYFSRNGIVNLVRSYGLSFNEEFKDTLRKMDWYLRDAKRSAGVEEMRLVSDLQQSFNRDREERLLAAERDRRAIILEWLAPTLFDTEFAEFLRGWTYGTCGWILRGEQYQQWSSSTDFPNAPRLLWISGNAGCGKSYLAHFLRTNLLSSKNPTGEPVAGPVLSFFFNSKAGEREKQTTVAFLRTILHQLLTSLDDRRIEDACYSVLQSAREKGHHKVASSSVYLWEAVEKTFPLIRNLRLIVDAFDECDDSERSAVMEKLVSLVHSKECATLKIIITSRPEPDILRQFDRVATEIDLRLRVSREDVDQDVQRYIRERLRVSETLGKTTKVREKVEKKLIGIVDGMFLYARLMIDELEKQGPLFRGDIDKSLAHLPKDLIALYSSVLDEIKSGSEYRCELARDIFLWVITAYRPLKLEGLLSALRTQRASDSDCEEEDESEVLFDARNHACFPLVEVLDDDMVQVVHVSVSQFLLGKEIDGKTARIKPTAPFAFEASSAHNEVAITCLKFLSTKLSVRKTRYQPKDRGEIGHGPAGVSPWVQPAMNDFLSYCVMNWDLHVHEAKKYFKEHRDSLLGFFDNQTHALSDYIGIRLLLDFRFKVCFRLKSREADPSPLHIAVYSKLYDLTNELIARGCNLEARDATDATALHLAAEKGLDEITGLLLSRGADKGAIDMGGMTPLHRAARNGHLSIVHRLLAVGANIETVDKIGRSALFLASEYGRVSTGQELLKQGADLSLRSACGSKPLSIASANGHYDMVRLLLGFYSDRKLPIDDDSGGFGLTLASRKGFLNVVEALIKAGVNVNTPGFRKYTALHEAASNGHQAIVEHLLKSGADIDVVDDKNCTALHKAAWEGKEKIVKYLLDKGASANIVDDWGYLPIHDACFAGHAAGIQLLIEAGSNVERVVSKKRTLLHFAAVNGHNAIVRLLLSTKIDINAVSEDDTNRTALHGAASKGHLGVVRQLLNAKAETNGVGKSKRSALHEAAAGGHDTVIKQLVLSGADIEARDISGRTALHEAALKGHDAAVKQLIQSGADFKAFDKSKRTTLHKAVSKGHSAVVQLLIKAGADVNAVDDFKRTPLHDAASNGHESVVMKLLDVKANLNAMDSSGYSPLMEASRKGRIVVVQRLLKASGLSQKDFKHTALTLHDAAENGQDGTITQLLQAGADINGVDQKHRTPLHYASSGGNETVVQQLIQAGATVNGFDSKRNTALHYASQNGHEKIVNRLLQAGADMRARDSSQCTPLHVASRDGYDGVVGQLIQAGADIHAKSQDEFASLHHAASNGHSTVVGQLLKAGASVDELADSENTSLHLASSKGHEAVVILLLQAGANLHSINYWNRQALHNAAGSGHTVVVHELLQAGAIVDALDQQKWTPLHYACDGGFADVVEELLEAGANVNVYDQNGKTPQDIAMKKDNPTILEFFRL